MKSRKKYIIVCLLAQLAVMGFTACSSGDDMGKDVPFAGFTMSTESAYTGDTIYFADNTIGGKGNYTYSWNFGDNQSSTEAAPIHIYSTEGQYIVTLNVTDSKGRQNSYSKVLTIRKYIPPVGDIQFLWVTDTYMGQFRSPSVTLTKDESRLYAVSEDHMLHCFDAKTGSQIWGFNLRDPKYGDIAGGNTQCTPAVDDDGTVYVGDGSLENKGKLFAINSDGTLKWFAYDDAETGFWNKGQTAAPTIKGTTPILDDKYVYCGNAGATGSFVAFDKATGKRVGYVTDYENPTAGPAGGVQQDPILTKQGLCFLYCQTWGLYAIHWDAWKYDGSNNSAIWKYLYQGHTTNGGSSAADEEGNIYCQIANKSATANIVKCLDAEGKEKWSTTLRTTGYNDQGGIVLGTDGTVYIACKPAGNYAGGIVALDGKTGKQLWHYKVTENVSSTPAIDKDGHIIFVTELGKLYIISSDGKETLISADIADNLSKSSYKVAGDWAAGQGKFWSAPIISSTGIIYVGMTNMQGERTKSTVVAFRSKYVSGPADSPWPMRGADAQHSCKVK